MGGLETSPVVIDVQHVTKKFRVYADRGATLKERVLFRKRRKYEDHWVLRDISFQVRQGEAIGLIGENGCGKSTTLKMLSRILYPDDGRITMQGRVSSLIELGAGFHPDLTGRENIYTNASIFGLKRQEIDRRLEKIISFSELEEYIDHPVRTYSSGMYMRLAFAVAINVDADILLIDEILAVGDAAFQAKCFKKLQEIKARGTTIVIVSHSLSQIEQICERTIWIDEGLIRMEGKPRDVHPQYTDYMIKKNQKREVEEEEEADDKTEQPDGMEETPDPAIRSGSGEARIEKSQVLDGSGKERNSFSPDEEITIRIEYTASEKLTNMVVGVAIYRKDQTYIYGTNTLIDTSEPVIIEGSGTIELRMERLAVTNGSYSIDLALHRPDGLNYDFVKNACTVYIADRVQTPGVIYLPHQWKID